MTRSISKDGILDAAEAIVCELGSGRLTLDAVAERAGVSKGGLMYHFPNKVTLLQGMIGRLIDTIEAMRGKVREGFGPVNPTELMVEIRTMSLLSENESQATVALLAAIANQPELMEPFRDDMRERFARRILSETNPERSTILFMAALGLHFAELLQMPMLDRPQRKQLFDRLLVLAEHRDEAI